MIQSAGRNLFYIFIAFVLLAVFVHLPYFNSPFLHDDIHSIDSNESLRSISNIPIYFTDSSHFSNSPDKAMYRPLLLTTYALNHAISGLDPWSWRLFNLILMAANATILVLLLRKWGIKPPWGIFAGTLFLIHPISGYSFLHVSTRSALLLAFFMLLGVATHMEAGRVSTAKVKWILLSLLCMAMGLLSVSAAVVFPALVLLVELPRLRVNFKSVVANVAPSAILAFFYLLSRSFLIGTTFGAEFKVSVWANLAVQAEAWWLYIRWTFFPFHMPVFVRLHDPFFGFKSEGVIAPVAALAVWVAIGLKCLFDREQSHKGLLLLWPLICYFPYAIIPLNVPVAYHHYYLPMAGIIGLIALIISQIKYRLAVPAGLIILCMGLLSNAADRPWRDSFAWATEAVRVEPSSGRAWNELGAVYREQARYDEAINSFLISREKNKHLAGVPYNLGLSYYLAEDYYRAILALDFYAIHPEVKSDYPKIDHLLGLALLKSGRPRSSMQYIDQALGIAPHEIDLKRARLEALTKIKQVNKAMESYTMLYGESLDNIETLKGRVELAIELGDVDAAMLYVEASRKYFNTHPVLDYLEARALDRIGAIDEALNMYYKALALSLTEPEEEVVKQRIREIEAARNEKNE